MTTRLIAQRVLQRALHDYPSALGLINTLADPACVSIDSRKVSPGDVFLAMRGEANDGHNFIAQAHQQGAALIIAESSYRDHIKDVDRLPIVLVHSSFKIFFDLARIHLELLDVTKVAITGSNGKTTTKEMIRAALNQILGEEFVYANAGTFNNHFGLPLSVLELTAKHRIAVFEMGMNHPQEIASLCSIVPPDVAAITNISGAHAGFFEDGIDGIQKAKGELFCALADNAGIAVVNLDDERVVAEADRYELKRRVNFGKTDHATVKLIAATPFSLTDGCQEISVLCEQNVVTVQLPLPGTHHAGNAVCALAVVHALGLSVEQGARGIKNMVQTKGRMSVSTSKDGHVLVNDGYNANPESMRAGILACRDLEASRRIAVIGVMAELGDDTASEHFELGRFLAKHFDHVLVCGQAALPTVEGAQEGGMNADQIVFKDSSLELIEPLQRMLAKGDLLFIKGSRSANMQAIADALKADW